MTNVLINDYIFPLKISDVDIIAYKLVPATNTDDFIIRVKTNDNYNIAMKVVSAPSDDDVGFSGTITDVQKVFLKTEVGSGWWTLKWEDWPHGDWDYDDSYCILKMNPGIIKASVYGVDDYGFRTYTLTAQQDATIEYRVGQGFAGLPAANWKIYTDATLKVSLNNVGIEQTGTFNVLSGEIIKVHLKTGSGAGNTNNYHYEQREESPGGLLKTLITLSNEDVKTEAWPYMPQYTYITVTGNTGNFTELNGDYKLNPILDSYPLCDRWRRVFNSGASINLYRQIINNQRQILLFDSLGNWIRLFKTGDKGKYNPLGSYYETDPPSVVRCKVYGMSLSL